MPRYGSIYSVARTAGRAQRQHQAQQRQQQREQQRLYLSSRVEEAELDSEALVEQIDALQNLLSDALSTDYTSVLEVLTESYYTARRKDPAPFLESYLPPDLGLKRFLPGAKERYAQEVASAEAQYQADLDDYNRREAERSDAIKQIDQWQADLQSGNPDAIVDYFARVLEESEYPDNFSAQMKVAFVQESKQLVVEHDLPTLDVIPEVASYKYVRSRDEITTTQRPANQRKALYSSVVAQIAIRTLHEIFAADIDRNIETVVFNGHVDAIDKSTGLPMRPCLVTLRTTRDLFSRLDLSRVDPIACLSTLSASFSRSPAELVPVRPVLEFNMVDSRFIEETNVISTLDQRPNLMELTPGEFEALISNLFEAMGLETRLTQASRDGGVDCVAYDPRPIFGGKVVIQAKRYKNTVGVSAVRDLFGTVQNEGASKGILVTTSGYGRAAYDFAAGKPLELLSGSNLLYLLKEHANIDARIEVPPDWKDPQLDTPDAS